MILSEPQETPYDVKFSIAGIPVRVHPMFWLMTLLPVMTGSRFDMGRSLVWIGVVFVSILIHELGHAFIARAFGARPWITLYAFGGLASYQPREMRNNSDPTVRSVLISLAGPAAGFVLAGLVIAVVVIAGYQSPIAGFSIDFDPNMFLSNPYFAIFVHDMVWVNIVWGAVNLLPVIPLDGGRVTEAVFVRMNGTPGYRQTVMTSMFVAASVSVFAAIQWQNMFVVVLFAYLAFMNWQIWQAMNQRGL